MQTGHANFVTGLLTLAFSADGRLLASTSINTNQVKLWDAARGHELRSLTANTGGPSGGAVYGVSALAFSDDNALVAAGGRDNSITLWETGSGRERARLSAGESGAMGSAAGILFLAFAPGGRTLVSLGDALRVWDTTSGAQLRSHEWAALLGGASVGGGYALSPDGALLALTTRDHAGSERTSVKFIDLANGRETRSVKMPDDYNGAGALLKFGPDGRLFSASQERAAGGGLRLWDVTAGGKGRVVETPPLGRDGYFTLSNDGRRLASADANTVRVYDAAASGSSSRPTVSSTARPPRGSRYSGASRRTFSTSSRSRPSSTSSTTRGCSPR